MPRRGKQLVLYTSYGTLDMCDCVCLTKYKLFSCLDVFSLIPIKIQWVQYLLGLRVSVYLSTNLIKHAV